MKLALHRSITFWSGILVMGFICWGWSDSMRAISGFRLPFCWGSQAAGGIATGISRSSHTTTFRIVTKASVSVLSGPHGGMSFTFDTKEPVPLLPRPLITANQGGAIFVPHWLLLLAVALPWTALVLWRARRRKRISTS